MAHFGRAWGGSATLMAFREKIEKRKRKENGF
jgi:hypothetical protein